MGHGDVSFLIIPSSSLFSRLVPLSLTHLISNIVCLFFLGLCDELPFISSCGHLRYIYSAVALFTGTGRQFIESSGDDAVFFCGALEAEGERPLVFSPLFAVFSAERSGRCALSVSAETASWESSLIGVVRPPPNGPDNEHKAQNNCTVAAPEHRGPAAVTCTPCESCVHREQQIPLI